LRRQHVRRDTFQEDRVTGGAPVTTFDRDLHSVVVFVVDGAPLTTFDRDLHSVAVFVIVSRMTGFIAVSESRCVRERRSRGHGQGERGERGERGEHTP
jgi:hypothetical protein